MTAKLKRTLAFTFFSLSLSIHTALAGPAQPEVEDLSWLAGKWVEEKEESGHIIEIRWETPSEDAMVGTWHTYRDGAMTAYEILTMRETPEGIVYRYDFFEKKKNFTNPTSFSFLLQNLESQRAVFTDLADPDWTLILEVDVRGALTGRQTNKKTGEAYLSYTAKKQ